HGRCLPVERVASLKARLANSAAHRDFVLVGGYIGGQRDLALGVKAAAALPGDMLAPEVLTFAPSFGASVDRDVGFCADVFWHGQSPSLADLSTATTR